LQAPRPLIEIAERARRLLGGARALRSSSKAGVVVAVGLTAFAGSTALLSWGTHDRPVLRLDVAFSANACCSWQVWVNGTSLREITVLPVLAGTETTYQVPLTVEHVSYLRMPLGQSKGMTVTFRDIRITRGSRTVSQADPASLPITAYFARKHTVPGGVGFTSTYTQPFLAVPVSLDTGEGRFRLLLASVEDKPLRGVVGLMLAGVIGVLLIAMRNRRQAVWLFGVVSVVALIEAVPWLSRQIDLRDSVRSAVGFASYQGRWKRREQFVVDAAVAVAILAPAALCAITRQVARPGPPLRRSALPALSRGAAALLVAGPVVVLAIAAAPNFRQLITGAPRYTPSWDSNNFVFWSYLIQKLHLVPMRDFFWPYGFQSLFNTRVPWGPLASYMTSLSFWLFLALGSYFALSRYFSGRSLLLRYLVLASFWVSVTLVGYWSFTVRYEAALAVVLLFAGLPTTAPVASWRRVAFAFAWAELVLLEPAQAIYASVPVGFLLLMEAVVSVERERRVLGGWLAKNVLTLTGASVVAVAVYALTGELRRTLSYYEELGAITSQAALPGQVDGWITSPTGLQSFLFWSVPLGLALGLFGLLSSRDRSRDASPAVVALALLGFMIMQKQTVRPGIESQIWLPVVFSIPFWAVSETRLDGLRRWSVVAAIAAGSVAVILVAGDYHSGWRRLAGGPDRLSNSVGALLHQRGALAATARQAFVPAAFERFGQYAPVVRELERVPSVRQGRPVWILGDDSPITMMLGAGWPYYYNDLYDTAPIDAQRLVLRRLALAPPTRVVWNFDTRAMVFDTVPQVVRVPLLFQWAVANLVPQTTLGTFAILRERQVGEPVPLAWWRRRIGTTVDLGHIPAVASLPSVPCVGTRPSCASYLVVTVPAGTSPPPAFHIPVAVDGVSFTVAFAPTARVERYVVPLDRLWFWRPGERGADRVLPAGTTNGVRVELVRRLVDPDALY
jgi:hypothetical protein